MEYTGVLNKEVKRTATILLFCLLLGSAATAQKDTLVDHWMKKGEKYLDKDSHDSALLFFNRSLDRLKKTGKDDPRMAIANNFIGDIYREKKQPQLSHTHLSEALILSRKLKLQYEKETALSRLLQLHREIVKYDLPFNYPAVAEKELTDSWFQLIDVKEAGDSVDAIVGGGVFDGIADSIQSVEIYTHISPKDTIYHKDLDFYGTARVVKVGPNQVQLRIRKKGKIPLLRGDFAIIRTAIPLAWRKLFLREFMLSGLYLVGNYRQSLFHFTRAEQSPGK